MRDSEAMDKRAEEIINDFATAAASSSAAFAIGGLIGLDKAYETKIYISMVQKLGELLGYKLEEQEAVSILQMAVASEVGSIGNARILLSWIPAIGNVANASIAFPYTQKLGRWVYLHLLENLSSGNISLLSEQRQSLEEAAREIQKLLKQLEQTNPIVTEDEMLAYVNDETTPSFKRRVVNALKASSRTAIEEFFDNPYTNIGRRIVRSWVKQE